VPVKIPKPIRRGQIKAFLKSAPCLLLCVGLFAPCVGSVSAGEFPPAGGLVVEADAQAVGKPLDHYWSRCVGAGRANEGLRAAWLEQLKLAHAACGFEYVRFHGLFHDDMFVYHERDGVVTYNWQYIDELFDRLLATGVRPFVELGFCPGDLASGESTVFWWRGHTAPPKDNAHWARLVAAFAEHCISRYGAAEVRRWYFEVWNEPNTTMFWAGTKSQYFELYRVSALALKGVDRALRVGGPATNNFTPDSRFDGEEEDRRHQVTLTAPDIDALSWKGAWIVDFLRYCAREKLPVDFVSTHPYPTDNAYDPVDGKMRSKTRKVGSVHDDLTWLRAAVAQSAFPDAELNLTEWNSSPSPRDSSHDFLQEAAYIIKVNLDCAGLAHVLSFWTFTDIFEEGGGGDTMFHGGFGLINAQGIVKPSFHAYRFLHALGDEVLQQTEGLIVTRDRATQVVSALIYHYPPELAQAIPRSGGQGGLDRAPAEKVLAMGQPRHVSLRIAHCGVGRSFRVETLDAQHGFALRAWQKMGSPEPASREQTQALRDAAMETQQEIIRTNDQGELVWERSLAPWTVVLIKEI
jgi:xylan 1,4-beta-xylosidase